MSCCKTLADLAYLVELAYLADLLAMPVCNKILPENFPHAMFSRFLWIEP